MQRIVLIALVIAMAGCHEQASDPSPSFAPTRPLVTDALPYQVARADVRAWHVHNGWCIRRQWPTTDEFVVCEAIHPYMNLRTPPMYAMAKYDAAGKSIAYATFTPVPCRMNGQCDRIYGRTVYASEHEFVDHFNGLYDHLADRGRAEAPQLVGLPSMQGRLWSALASELDRRFGAATWREPHDYGATWATPTSTIGLFVGGSGGWIIETHELRTTALSSRSD
jgi:hypothetical protein